MKIEFIETWSLESVTAASSWGPRWERKEIPLLGRSNAGKSSLINALAQKSVAHVSAKPGKTCCLNFYSVDRSCAFVDLPGYGYAVRSKTEREDWKNLVEGYLAHRPHIAAFLLAIDSRRAWSSDEDLLFDFILSRERPLFIVFTKIDKLNQAEKQQLQKLWQQRIRAFPQVQVFTISATKRLGLDSLREAVDALFRKK